MSDREKLLKLLLEHCDYKGQIDCKEDCERCLADHLIANGVVVREKGGWTLTVDGQGNARLKCHNCNEEMCLSEDNGEELPRFCPNCGADMRRRENG